MNSPPINISLENWLIVQRILQARVGKYEVWAFGSRVTGNPKKYSDLDLVIVSDEPLDLATQADLANDFSESDLPWKVDIVDWAATSPEFRRIILANKVIVQLGARREAP